MKILKKLKVRPSEVALTLAIVLILGISAIFSIDAFLVEYVLLNMAMIVWLFAQLDTSNNERFFHYWVFLTVVMWILMAVVSVFYCIGKLADFIKSVGDRIDKKFGK